MSLPKKIKERIDHLIDNDGIDVPQKIAAELWQEIERLREALSQTVDEAKRDYKFKAITAQEALTASKAKFGESKKGE